jgi:hypothetical protein
MSVITDPDYPKITLTDILKERWFEPLLGY